MLTDETKQKIERFTSPDFLFLLPTLVLATVFLIAINNSEWITARTTDSMGTGFIPRLGGGIVIVGTVLALIETRKFPTIASSEGPGAKTFHYLFIPAVVAAVYIYAAYAIGLVVVTVIALPAYFYANGIRAPKILIPLSLVGTAAIYVFFIRMLGLFFPASRFF